MLNWVSSAGQYPGRRYSGWANPGSQPQVLHHRPPATGAVVPQAHLQGHGPTRGRRHPPDRQHSPQCHCSMLGSCPCSWQAQACPWGHREPAVPHGIIWRMHGQGQVRSGGGREDGTRAACPTREPYLWMPPLGAGSRARAGEELLRSPVTRGAERS